MHGNRTPLHSRSCSANEWNTFRNERDLFDGGCLAGELTHCKKLLQAEVARNHRLVKQHRELQSIVASNQGDWHRLRASDPDYWQYRSKIEDTAEEIRFIESCLPDPNKLIFELNKLHEAVRSATQLQQELLYEIQEQENATREMQTREERQHKPNPQQELSPQQQMGYRLKQLIDREKQNKVRLAQRVTEQLGKHCKLVEQRRMLKQRKR